MSSWLLALALIQDGTPFESKEYGIKLTIPAGWTVDATKQTGVILKIRQKESELAVYEMRAGEPVTLGQYKEQLRLFLTSGGRDFKLVDDRSVELAGKKGFVFALEGKTSAFKGLWAMSPTRFIAIDADEIAPADYDTFLSSVGWIARDAPAVDGPAKKFAMAPVKIDMKQNLRIVSGDTVLGTYNLQVRSTDSGYEFAHHHKADFGAEGREEYSIKGFVAADLSRQRVERSYFRYSKEKRGLYFWASAELSDGKAKIKARINGEAYEATIDVAPGTILMDALEGCQPHFLELGNGLSTVPLLNVFDSEPIPTLVECLGKRSIREDDQTKDIWVLSVAKQDRVLTYWYGADRKIIRITGLAPGIVVKP